MLELKNSKKIRDEDIFLEFLINFEKDRKYSKNKNFEINFKTKNSILLFIFNFYKIFFSKKKDKENSWLFIIIVFIFFSFLI